MLRVGLFILFVVAAAVGAAWFADRPGDVSIDWLGYRFEASVGVVVALLAIASAALVGLSRLWFWLRRTPINMADKRRQSRRQRGDKAVTQAMVSLAAGEDEDAAKKIAQANDLLEGAPLALLLSAQLARRRGDDPAAEAIFAELLEGAGTEFLGVRGATQAAIETGNRGEAIRLAQRACNIRPKSPWAAQTLIDLQAVAGDWDGAAATLRGAIRKKALTPDQVARRKLVVQLARAQQANHNGDPAGALRLAQAALAVDPGFAPAVRLAAGLLALEGKSRKAARLIEDAWARQPHPDLVRAYGAMSFASGVSGIGGSSGKSVEETAEQRWKRMQKLSARNPDHPETHLAMAEQALAANRTDNARRHLTALEGQYQDQHQNQSRRFCSLMQRLEQAEQPGNRDAGSIWAERAAKAPADPHWLCRECGVAQAEWQPVCVSCQLFDGLVWGEDAPRDATGGALPSPVDALLN